MKNIKKMKNSVHQKVQKEIINSMLLEDRIRRLKNRLWGDISLRNGIYLCLYYLLNYCSMSTLEEEFGYPHSNFPNLLSKVLRNIQPWCKRLLKSYSLDHYREIILEKNWSKKFQIGNYY